MEQDLPLDAISWLFSMHNRHIGPVVLTLDVRKSDLTGLLENLLQLGET